MKGIAKIPDYIQLRDEQFTLLAYFRVDRPEKSIEKCGLGEHSEYINELINTMPFEVIQKLTFNVDQ